MRRAPAHAATSASASAGDRKSTRLNSSHLVISYAVFCLKKKKNTVLSVGALLASVLVFGPAPRRWQTLEVAARRVGACEGAWREPDSGGDANCAVERRVN